MKKKPEVPEYTGEGCRDNKSLEWTQYVMEHLDTLDSAVRMQSKFLTIYTFALIAAVCAGIIFL